MSLVKLMLTFQSSDEGDPQPTDPFFRLPPGAKPRIAACNTAQVAELAVAKLDGEMVRELLVEAVLRDPETATVVGDAVYEKLGDEEEVDEVRCDFPFWE